MAKKSKALRAAIEKIDATKLYSVEEAVALAKETSFAKFDATVEVAYNLNIDVKKSDQQIRGATVLVKLLVFSFSLKVRKLKKLQQLVQTSLVLMNSLLKSTVDGWTSTLLSQHLI